MNVKASQCYHYFVLAPCTTRNIGQFSECSVKCNKKYAAIQVLFLAH